MDIREECQKLKDYHFNRKDAVESLLEKGFNKEDIQSAVKEYFPEKKFNHATVAFLVSLIGQILLIAFFGLGYFIEMKFWQLLIVIALIALTAGFYNVKKYAILTWFVIFLLAIVGFLALAITKKFTFAFSFSLLASIAARYTFQVYQQWVETFE